MKLRELAVSYLESRNNAIKYIDNSPMVQVCNEAASATRKKAMELGCTEEDWNDMIQLVWNEQQTQKGNKQ